jgi:hypothetical protein
VLNKARYQKKERELPLMGPDANQGVRVLQTFIL